MKKPLRYRDVLSMLKEMARDERVSSDGLRAVLAGNIGEAYTQADIQRTRELAAELGWELGTALEPSDPETTFDAPERYQEEIRRLHAALRAVRDQVTALERVNTIAQEKSTQRNKARRAQLDAAGVGSIDEAFVLLKRLMDALEKYGAHEAECGMPPDRTASMDEKVRFIEEDHCTCGLAGILAQYIADEQPNSADAAGSHVQPIKCGEIGQ